jgi:hypothetical protein
LAVLALTAGCRGDDDRSASSRRSSPAAPTTTLAPTTTTRAPTTLAPTPTPTTVPAPAECVQRPDAVIRNSYSGLPQPDGPSIDYATREPVDGRGNRYTAEGSSVVRRGPDGTITVAAKAPLSVGLHGFGDFDGDGRSDFLVEVWNVGTFIVRGSLDPGRYHPENVGVQIDPPRSPDGHAYDAAAVGDQDGDGAEDVSFGPRLYSGRALTSPNGRRSAPLRTLPAPYSGLLQLDPAGPPTFVVPEPPSKKNFTVLGTTRYRLRLDVPPGDQVLSMPSGLRAHGWLVNGHRIVELEYGTRSGSNQWRFDLDAPCEG